MPVQRHSKLVNHHNKGGAVLISHCSTSDLGAAGFAIKLTTFRGANACPSSSRVIGLTTQGSGRWVFPRNCKVNLSTLHIM